MSSLSLRVRSAAEARDLEVVYCFKDGAALSASFGTAVLQVLDDLQSVEVWGTSSGALVGSALGAGYDPFQIQRVIESINIWQIGWDLCPWRKLRGGAWFDWGVTERWMRGWLKPRVFADFQLPVHVMASREDPGHRLGWSRAVFSPRHTPQVDPVQALMASMAVNKVFHPVEIGGVRHIDGANATSKTWREVAAHANGRRFLILVVNPVFKPQDPGLQKWVNPTARWYDHLLPLRGGHTVAVVNLVWGKEHPFNFPGTMSYLHHFRLAAREELGAVCTLLEKAGGLSEAG